MIYLFPKGGSADEPIFKLDATLEQKRTSAYETTEQPVEEGADLPDYVKRKPKEYSASGVLTTTPQYAAKGWDRVSSLVNALTTKADNREIVTCVFQWQVFDAIVTNVEEAVSKSEGQSLRVSIGLKEIRQVTTAKMTNIPPSRLKPKQRRRTKKPKGGGAATPKDADAKTKKAFRSSAAYKAKKFMSRMFGG